MNTHNLTPGDTIQFKNKVGHLVVIRISRTSDKSVWNERGHRESWATINGHIERYNATIKRGQL